MAAKMEQKSKVESKKSKPVAGKESARNPAAKKTSFKPSDKLENNKPELYKNLSRDNPKHAKVWRFIDEYCVDFNGTQAAIRAGYSVKTANVQASQFLANINIIKEIDINKAAISKRTGVDQDYVMEKLKKVAEARASALSQVHVNCCRHCWHPEFLYQYTPHELREAMERHYDIEAEKELRNKEYVAKPFDEKGGDTFKRNLKPNPDCVECCGEGITRVVLKDTRDLSDDDLFLYDGAEYSKDGMKVKHLSREAAIDKLARHTGFYEKDNEVTVGIFDAESLEAKFCKKIEKSNARQEEVERERCLPARNK